MLVIVTDNAEDAIKVLTALGHTANKATPTPVDPPRVDDQTPTPKAESEYQQFVKEVVLAIQKHGPISYADLTKLFPNAPQGWMRSAMAKLGGIATKDAQKRWVLL